MNSETGRYVGEIVGRCDRESTCGYHLKPGEYFAGIGEGWKPESERGTSWQGRRRETRSQAAYSQRTAAQRPDLIDNRHLLESLRNYDKNSFVQFLLDLFPFDPNGVIAAVSDYKIGTGRNCETIFWQIDRFRKIRTGKLIDYDARTGKRRKDVRPNWVHAELKRYGLVSTDFNLRQCFFGEHLLSTDLNLPIAIVEAEKTAVICSICKGVFPDLLWLACGGKSILNAARLIRLGRERRIILFPDADSFDKWQTIASDARGRGLDIIVSDLIERHSTEAEKANGFDLADYLICEQRKRNDPVIREAFRDLIEERLAIMIADGGLTLEQAESEMLRSGFYERAISDVTRSGE